jgi:hypothetical protein
MSTPFNTQCEEKPARGKPAEVRSGVEITHDMISEKFQHYILNERPGLQRFYKKDADGSLDRALKGSVDRAVSMINKIMQKRCKWETAFSLSVIALYDVVMLLGMN